MLNSFCFDTASGALVAMDCQSKTRTTTHHDLPSYLVRTALVLAVNTSKVCTNAPCQSPNNYRQVTSFHVKIWI